jgi:fibronectin-binding autotransporter adhesin
MNARSIYSLAIITLAGCLAAEPAHGMAVEGGNFTYTGSATLRTSGTLTLAGNGMIDFGAIATTNNLFNDSPGVNITSSALNVLGAGTLTLNAINTYSGATTLNAGTLVLAGSPTRIATPVVTSGNVNFGTLGSVSGGRLTLGQPGSLTLVGTGQLAPVIVNSGIVAGGTLNSGTGATFKANASATWATSPPTTSVLAVGGSTVSAGSISLVRNSSSSGLMGPFLSPPSSTWSVPTGLTQVGAGTLTLSGTNSYAGGTLVTAGTLTLNSQPSLTWSSPSLTKAGLGTLTLSGANSYSDAALVTAGTLAVNMAVGTPSEITFVGPGLPNATSASAALVLSLSSGSANALTLTAVPEPSSLFLAVLALAALVAAHRARQRVSSPLRPS